ncbi:hypothetical protein TOK_2517 [Pseudonocardia sp. N23]|nr:hypothetical protein TOK_2517 [Pseudonocardia sp. N23]
MRRRHLTPSVEWFPDRKGDVSTTSTTWAADSVALGRRHFRGR